MIIVIGLMIMRLGLGVKWLGFDDELGLVLVRVERR